MAIFYYVMCHNIKPSIIIIDDGNQYFKNNYYKNLHNATCQVSIDGWKLLMLAWHYGYSYSGVG